jgi:type I restriction enzyme S subunit
MKLNYKKLAPYIQEVDIRNTEDKKDNLLGVSTQKVFIKSIANTVGTDFKSYKIVKKGQFTYVSDTSRRGDKIGIALLEDEDQGLVSQAYTVFEVIDTEKLLPEYLMMWFRRPEFDRYARYMSYGSVGEIFSWEEMGNVELPIPDITKQREIVKEYNVLVNCIALNNQLIQKLEETAQAIYKQWFVDFEFPDQNGKSYKSNGGEMIESELGDIPKGWKYLTIQELIDEKIIDKNQDGNHGEIHPKSSDYVEKGVPFIMAKDVINGTLNLDSCNFISDKQAKSLRIGFAKSNDVLLTHKGTMGRVAIIPKINNFIVLTPQVTYYRVINHKRISKEYLYNLFTSPSFQNILNEQSDQSTRKFISILNQRLIKVIFPSQDLIYRHKLIMKPILEFKRIKTLELIKYNSIKDILEVKISKA